VDRKWSATAASPLRADRRIARATTPSNLRRRPLRGKNHADAFLKIASLPLYRLGMSQLYARLPDVNQVAGYYLKHAADERFDHDTSAVYCAAYQTWI